MEKRSLFCGSAAASYRSGLRGGSHLQAVQVECVAKVGGGAHWPGLSKEAGLAGSDACGSFHAFLSYTVRLGALASLGQQRGNWPPEPLFSWFGTEHAPLPTLPPFQIPMLRQRHGELVTAQHDIREVSQPVGA